MERNNRYDRYRDDDNRSSNYREDDYNNRWSNRNPENRQQNYSGDPYGSSYNRDSDYRNDDYLSDNWQNRPRDEYGDSRYRSNEQNYGRNSNDRNSQWRNNDWNERKKFDTNYENRNRNKDRNNDRDWLDKTADEVSSWFGDKEAKNRRIIDHLNEGKHRGKGPKNYKRTEEKIKEDVSERLSEDDYIDASDIDVQVNGTEVSLIGTVDSRAVKRRAEDVVDRVAGVTHVQNNLRVANNSETQNDIMGTSSPESHKVNSRNSDYSSTNGSNKEIYGVK